ncbi:zinc metalloprotease, partial [Lasius niger]
MGNEVIEEIIVCLDAAFKSIAINADLAPLINTTVPDSRANAANKPRTVSPINSQRNYLILLFPRKRDTRGDLALLRGSGALQMILRSPSMSIPGRIQDYGEFGDL